MTEELRFDSQRAQQTLLFSKASRPDIGPKQDFHSSGAGGSFPEKGEAPAGAWIFDPLLHLVPKINMRGTRSLRSKRPGRPGN